MINLEDLQKAIYSNLEGLGPKVYDHRPNEPEYPYIRFNLSVTDISTKTEVNFEVGLDVLVFSTYPGNKEINSLTNQIKLLITDSSLSSDNNQAQVFLDNTDILDDDEELKAAVLNYRILLT